jgi:PIN domain nuclease of toxin-antitoxin system
MVTTQPLMAHYLHWVLNGIQQPLVLTTLDAMRLLFHHLPVSRLVLLQTTDNHFCLLITDNHFCLYRPLQFTHNHPWSLRLFLFFLT